MLIDEIKSKALENNVPIIRDETAKILMETIKQLKPKNILEIGSAVGYSALLMSSSMDDNVKITSLEKDESRYFEAKENVKALNKNNIEFVLGDAMDFLKGNNVKFDFVFLDGPKAQYKNYLPFILECLNLGGILFTDNVLFRGYVNSKDDEIIPKHHRGIVRKLREFNQMIENNDELQTNIYDIDDGFAISKKVK